MAAEELLVWRSARLAASLAACCSRAGSRSSSLLHVRVLGRRTAAGLVCLEWQCLSSPSATHSRWLDASSVTFVAPSPNANLALGRGSHEPPFEDDNDAQLRLFTCPRLGRFVAAKREIPVGACAMRATAFAVVVADRAATRHCHWCFTQLAKKAFRCGACEFALYCSRDCLDADAVLHDPQCEALRAVQAAPTAWIDKEALRLALAVLRMEVFVQNTQALAGLNVPMVNNGDFARDQALDQAARLLRRSLKSSPSLSSVPRAHIRQTIQRVQSNVHPLLVNGTTGFCGLGIFPEAAMTLNHSCSPNVVPSFDPKTRTLKFHAVRAIARDELIEYSYLSDLTVASARRQETLRAAFGFDCECARCVHSDKGKNAVEEQELLQRLVELSSQNDFEIVQAKLQTLETRHGDLLQICPDVEFSLKMLELRCATQTKDWPRVLSIATRLLELWEAQGLPSEYHTTETLHQQIAVAALRLGDSARKTLAMDRVREIQHVCGFQEASTILT